MMMRFGRNCWEGEERREVKKRLIRKWDFNENCNGKVRLNAVYWL
jgi:chromosome condensin MukBEF MukE localization factor